MRRGWRPAAIALLVAAPGGAATGAAVPAATWAAPDPQLAAALIAALPADGVTDVALIDHPATSGAYWAEPSARVLARLRTGPGGLDPGVAAERLATVGRNELRAQRRPSRLRSACVSIRTSRAWRSRGAGGAARR